MSQKKSLISSCPFPACYCYPHPFPRTLKRRRFDRSHACIVHERTTMQDVPCQSVLAMCSLLSTQGGSSLSASASLLTSSTSLMASLVPGLVSLLVDGREDDSDEDIVDTWLCSSYVNVALMMDRVLSVPVCELNKPMLYWACISCISTSYGGTWKSKSKASFFFPCISPFDLLYVLRMMDRCCRCLRCACSLFD